MQWGPEGSEVWWEAEALSGKESGLARLASSCPPVSSAADHPRVPLLIRYNLFLARSTDLSVALKHFDICVNLPWSAWETSVPFPASCITPNHPQTGPATTVFRLHINRIVLLYSSVYSFFPQQNVCKIDPLVFHICNFFLYYLLLGSVSL